MVIRVCQIGNSLEILLNVYKFNYVYQKRYI